MPDASALRLPIGAAHLLASDPGGAATASQTHDDGTATYSTWDPELFAEWKRVLEDARVNYMITSTLPGTAP
jgi:hypothetical protein